MADAKVLLIYTGGTIGSVRAEPENPDSPLVPAGREELLDHLPQIARGRVELDAGPVEVEVVATEAPMDSSQVRPAFWLELAQTIEEQYEACDGFVVLHGTDTMAYTASALAFLFDHLNKPVILTGSQRPLGAARSDAAQNVLTAVEIAAAAGIGGVVVPEVCVYFDGQLLRGCRATKLDADGYRGFDSPNLPPLGEVGSRIEIREELLMPGDGHALQVRGEIHHGVAVLELSPLMDPDLFERVLEAEGLRGVILKAYGAGNAPGGRTLEILGRAVERGVAIVVVTQCHAGTVRLGQYGVSAGLLERGVISGLDMTPEAAQAKLAVLLADEESLFAPEELMQVNLKGEMEGSLFNLAFGSGEADPAALLTAEGPVPAATYFEPSRIRSATLRLGGLVVEEGEGPAELAFFVGGEAGPQTPLRGGRFGAVRRVWPEEGEVHLFAEITSAVRRQISRTKRARLAVVCRSGHRVRWQAAHLAMVTD